MLLVGSLWRMESWPPCWRNNSSEQSSTPSGEPSFGFNWIQLTWHCIAGPDCVQPRDWVLRAPGQGAGLSGILSGAPELRPGEGETDGADQRGTSEGTRTVQIKLGTFNLVRIHQIIYYLSRITEYRLVF